jgi:UDPglucose 6-dehydrogenase/GDP-mannose 6-dehydrogenase
MKVGVIGTGYVGLVSGVCLAAKGHEIKCLDVRREVVERLNRGIPHIYEKGLESLLSSVLAAGRFRAEIASVEALKGCEVILIAVGTPSTEGRIDLSQVEAASRLAGSYLRNQTSPCSVIVKSTVVPGTTDTAVRGWLEAESGRKMGDFGLGMNPEFLREGEAVEDFMTPDRIVLGGETPGTWDALEKLYEAWSCEKLRVNSRTAEMIKYANNAILATVISASNELANAAAAIGGIDIYEVMAGVHADKRWSPLLPDGERIRPGILTYLWPGCGFGGSCFPKDVQALLAKARDAGAEAAILSSVLRVNREQPHQILAILKRATGPLRGRRVVVLGLAFKPETDDVRESASRTVLADLAGEGALVMAHDPMAADNARRSWPELGVQYVSEWEPCVAQAAAVVVVTAWREYLKLRTSPLREELRGRVLFDARRLFSKQDFPGAVYLTIGNRPLERQTP